MKRGQVIFVSFACALIQACNSGDVTNISANGDNVSHNTGKNCMSCHASGESGTGWFTVSGTVYDSTQLKIYPNALVSLYTGVEGTGSFVANVQVDAKGNFYTTESIDFALGLYPRIEGETSVQYMQSKITTGACNSCHVSSNRMWAR